jgi:hypothetical protein
MFTTIELAKKIIESLAKWTGKKLERNHKVLKLLKAIGIGALEDKFDSIYNHTLVEYAVDANPIELTLLFAAKDVKKAFQQNLYKNDQPEFEKTLEKQLLSNKKLAILTHIYKNAGDLEPEVQAFRNLFDYFAMQAANPLMLRKYNEDKKFQYRISHKSFRDYLTAQAFVIEINSGKIEHFARDIITEEINHFILEQKP